jgi:hypothetical protein
LGGKGLLRTAPFSHILAIAFPEQNWEISTLQKSGFSKKSQHLLKVILKTIFPHQGIIIFLEISNICRGS